MINCVTCKGTGTYFSAGFSYEGRTYPDRTSPCTSCNGAKQFPDVDVTAILAAIVTGKAPNRRFRKSAPKHWGNAITVADRRAYYVWRLARFHGGADVCLPMTAMDMVRGDPFKDALESLSDAVAKRVFGTSRAAASRWAPLLVSGSHVAQAGLPDSAYPGGRVADGNKPEWELAELI